MAALALRTVGGPEKRDCGISLAYMYSWVHWYLSFKQNEAADDVSG